jgi:hypothetical protein
MKLLYLTATTCKLPPPLFAPFVQAHMATSKIFPLPISLHRGAHDDANFDSLSGYRAAIPRLNPTKSFWTDGEDDCNPLAKQGSSGNLPNNVDVCIIGSGITGVSVAYHLSEIVKQRQCDDEKKKPNLTVAIVEARDFCEAYNGISESKY